MHLNRRPRPLNTFGDTIVEVMVVLAILGMALGVSYATANRSLLDARQAQENSQATELVQAQIEALRTLSSATAVPNIFDTTTYCLSTTVPYTKTANCLNGFYTITISYSGPVSPSPNIGGTFTVLAKWDDVEGQGKDTVTLLYRLYQQTP